MDKIKNQIKNAMEPTMKTMDPSPVTIDPYYHDHLLDDVMNKKYI
jgi:hypothetical protein